MRFCMVTTFYPPYNYGGDGYFVRNLSRALVRRGHEVHVVHCRDAYRMRSGEPDLRARAPDGVQVHQLSSEWRHLSPLISHQFGSAGPKATKLREMLSGSFDVVNFHNVSLMGAPSILGWSQARVTLYTFHDHWFLCPTHCFWKNRAEVCQSKACFSCAIRSGVPPQLWRFGKLLKRSLRHIDTFLSPSQFTADKHLAEFPDIPITVLPTFSYAPPADPVSLNSRDGFIYAGRLTRAKGVDALLKLFQQMPSHRLTLLGDGELASEARSIASTHPNIEYLGKQPQESLHSCYSKARALILPSRAPEVFPLVVLEAMSQGLPVITTDAGGASEAVKSSGGGRVVRSDSEMREAVELIARDDLLWQKQSRLGREGYLNRYTEERYLESYLSLIASRLDRVSTKEDRRRAASQ